MSSIDYDPNSLNAVLSRIEANQQTIATALERFQAEVKEDRKAIYVAFKSHAKDVEESLAKRDELIASHASSLEHLKATDKERTKVVKWGMAAASAIGWAISTFVSWKASQPPAH